MGCCGSKKQRFPLSEILLIKIIKQPVLSSFSLPDISVRYYNNIQPLKLTKFSSHMKSLLTPVLYPDEKEKKSLEDLLTQHFLSFYSEPVDENENMLFYMFIYCVSFSKNEEKEKDIFNFLKKEKLNTNMWFNKFLEFYIKINIKTMTELVYDFCTKNVGKKVFDIEINQDFMKEFSEVKNEIINNERIEKYIRNIQEKGKFRDKELNMNAIMRANNNCCLFNFEKLRNNYFCEVFGTT